MYNDRTIAAVIPAYNEEAFIENVLRTLPPFIDHAYVIDDGSTDATWERITAIADTQETQHMATEQPPVVEATNGGTAMPTIVPIRHPENRGVGAAIKTGYRHAFDDGLDVFVVIAGDGQTAPDVVERIVRPVAEGRVDYAKGNRLLQTGRRDMPRFRQVGNFTLSLLTKIASGYWKIMDPQNGSTAITRDALDRIDLDSLYDGYGFENEMLITMNVHGMRIADVSRRAVYDTEKSHIKYSSFIPRTSWLLLGGFLWRLHEKYLIRDFHPLALFYFVGAATALVGLAGWVWRVVFGGPAVSYGVVFVLGWLFMLHAMVLDMKENEDLQVVMYDQPVFSAGTDKLRETDRPDVPDGNH